MKLIIVLFFSNIALAQQNTPFDMIEASKLALQSDQALKKINGSGHASKCETLKSTNGEAVTTCSVDDADYETPILKMDYDVGEVPAEIKAQLPDQFVNDTKDKKISCVYRFKISNDNQQMLGRSEKKSIQNNKYGDDFGRTHGMDVGVSCVSNDGISNAFTYSTDLYSDPDRMTAKRLANGNVSMKQKFTSENIFALLQDNINQGKVTYWKRGVGFINLSEKKKWGLMQSTGQQEWYHHVYNNISAGSAYQYENMEGAKDQWGAFVTLAIGLQENRKFGDRCKLKLNADVGARISSLKDTSTLNLNLQGKLSYQVTQNASMYLRAQSETIIRSSSRITENTLAAGIETNAGSYFEGGIMSQSGNRKDVSDKVNFLTGKNDLQVIFKVGYKY
jgi:hypothetical protein